MKKSLWNIWTWVRDLLIIVVVVYAVVAIFKGYIFPLVEIVVGFIRDPLLLAAFLFVSVAPMLIWGAVVLVICGVVYLFGWVKKRDSKRDKAG